jgi:tetratricopeptide (TPR) repeat protein
MRYETVRRAAPFAMACVLSMPAPGLAQQREYYIRGRVLETDKAPLPGVEVRLREPATSRTYDVKTDKQGVFKLAGLPHGVYEVAFEKDGYVAGQAKWNFETPQDTMQRVEVPDTLLVSQSRKAEMQVRKEADSGLKEAAEKLKKGDLDSAIVLLRAALQRNADDAQALFYLGLAHNLKKNHTEAVVALTRVVELTPAFAPAHFELGTAHRRLGDLQKALASYDKGHELDSAHADAAFNAGLILFETNRIDEAQARFEKALAAKPGDADLLEMAARCAIHQTKFDKAVELLQKARAATTDAARIAFFDELIKTTKAQQTGAVR